MLANKWCRKIYYRPDYLPEHIRLHTAIFDGDKLFMDTSLLFPLMEKVTKRSSTDDIQHIRAHALMWLLCC
jgi:hypothetical protein